MIEINDKSRRKYSTNSQIKCKNLLISLCDYSDEYIRHIPTALDVVENNANKKVIFKNGTSFNNCISCDCCA